ncbi:MAG: CopG family ribbon-helix-helix protein [Candidatus Hodarchaeota archaeon]
MTEENQDSEKEKEDSIRISVYLPSDLLDEIDEYKKKKKYATRSELFRMAFRTLQKIYPIEVTEGRRKSIEEYLMDIENRLEKIELEQKILENEDSMIQNKSLQIQLEEEDLQNEILDVSPEDIPNFSEIENEILDFLSSYPDNRIKDFVLMEHFRKQYSESVIWAVLVHLKKKNKLKLKNGIWSFNAYE